jgi:hypothetical protein
MPIRGEPLEIHLCCSCSHCARRCHHRACRKELTNVRSNFHSAIKHSGSRLLLKPVVKEFTSKVKQQQNLLLLDLKHRLIGGACANYNPYGISKRISLSSPTSSFAPNTSARPPSWGSSCKPHSRLGVAFFTVLKCAMLTH